MARASRVLPACSVTRHRFVSFAEREHSQTVLAVQRATPVQMVNTLLVWEHAARVDVEAEIQEIDFQPGRRKINISCPAQSTEDIDLRLLVLHHQHLTKLQLQPQQQEQHQQL